MRQMRNISKGKFVLLLIIALVLIILATFQSHKKLPNPPSSPTTLYGKGFLVQIPQKALFKNYVTVSVEVESGTSCELTLISPSGDISQMETTAGVNGLCIWKWKVDETKGKGNARLIFTIEGISETHFIEILSSF